LSTCTNGPRMPAVDGAVMEIRRSDASLGEAERGYDSTLQVSWFGSGCHLIQLGGLRVLTDPFVSNGEIESKKARVDATFGQISAPQVVLVNHSHFDHFLDAHAALSLPGWEKTTLHGGASCENLLAGWGDKVRERCENVPEGGGLSINRRIEGGYHLRVTAYQSLHPPHLACGTTFLNDRVTEARTSRPSIADYEAGEVFNYLIEMRGPTDASFKVFYLGAPYDLGKLPDSLPHGVTDVDVAIFLAPTGLNVPGYPEQHLARLRPRHIVLNHYNTFFKEDPDAQLYLAGKDFVQFNALSRKMQQAFVSAKGYPEFEALHVPAITVMDARDRGRNVLRFGR
jgi:L-ascorbate metabolism protein UlaG (beta-lactamase superfamily)